MDSEQITNSRHQKIVPVSKIRIWDEANIRHTQITEGLEELAESIKTLGLLQPPLVQRVEDSNDEYKIVMGQRRFLAIRDHLHWTEMPVIVTDQGYDETHAKIASLTENIQRKPVDATDLAEACKFLKDKLGDDERAAKEIGISIGTFRKYLGFYNAPPEIKQLVQEKEISVFDANRITQIVPDVDQAVKFAKIIADLPKPKKDRYFAVVTDNPKTPIKDIPAESERFKFKNNVSIYLADVYARALGKASMDRSEEPEFIAQKAVVEWLEKAGYVVKL